MFKQKMMVILRKLPKIVAILLSIALVVYLGLELFISIYFKPHDVRLTNVTDTSFTISWITNYPKKGIVYYKEKDSILPGFLSWIGTKKAYDDRDIALAEQDCVEKFNKEAKVSEDFVVDTSKYGCNEVSVKKVGEYYVHHVTLTDLDELKEYYFRVGDGLFSRKMDLYKNATFAGINREVETPAPIFGSIVNDKGESVNDAVVYVKFINGYLKKESMYYSSVTASDGSWYLDGNNIRTIEGEPILVENGLDMIEVYAQYQNYTLSDANDWVYGNGDFAYPDIVVSDTWQKDLSMNPTIDNGNYIGLVRKAEAASKLSRSENAAAGRYAAAALAYAKKEAEKMPSTSTTGKTTTSLEDIAKIARIAEETLTKVNTRAKEIAVEESGSSEPSTPPPSTPPTPTVTNHCKTGDLSGCSLDQLTNRDFANTIGIGFVMNKLANSTSADGKVRLKGKEVSLLEAYNKLGLCNNAVACAGNLQAAGVSKGLQAHELICYSGQDCTNKLFAEDGSFFPGKIMTKGGEKGITIGDKLVKPSPPLSPPPSSPSAKFTVKFDQLIGEYYIELNNGYRFQINKNILSTNCLNAINNGRACNENIAFASITNIDALLSMKDALPVNVVNAIKRYIESETNKILGLDGKVMIADADGYSIYIERDTNGGLRISGGKPSTQIKVTNELIKLFPGLNAYSNQYISLKFLQVFVNVANRARYGIIVGKGEGSEGEKAVGSQMDMRDAIQDSKCEATRCECVYHNFTLSIGEGFYCLTEKNFNVLFENTFGLSLSSYAASESLSKPFLDYMESKRVDYESAKYELNQATEDFISVYSKVLIGCATANTYLCVRSSVDYLAATAKLTEKTKAYKQVESKYKTAELLHDVFKTKLNQTGGACSYKETPQDFWNCLYGPFTKEDGNDSNASHNIFPYYDPYKQEIVIRENIPSWFDRDVTSDSEFRRQLQDTVGTELKDFYSRYDITNINFANPDDIHRYKLKFDELDEKISKNLREKSNKCGVEAGGDNSSWIECVGESVVDTNLKKELCDMGNGTWGNDVNECEFPSIKGASDSVLGAIDSSNTLGSGYITYLPEYGFFDMEIAGLKETDKVEGNTLRIFYIEANGIEGFQMPKDPDNPKETEDIMLKSNSLNISYKKSAEVMTLNLKRGINLVSFNYIPKIENDQYSKASSMLKWLVSKGVRVEHISYFSGGRWKGIGYVGGQTTGDDFNITPGKGYLIYTEADTTVSIPGYKITSSVPVPLSAGWNLVGIHGYSQMYTARSFIDSINSVEGLTANNVSWWPTSKGKYEGLQVVDGKQYGFDFSLSSSNGYFVRISKFSPKDSKCKSLLWHAGGSHSGACGGSK